ncbi:putative secreted protein [Candidatus Protochlamydia naegleriophila]|uniref:Putative secreted protein n=1 Tax=Candidatus Protochlamydia naegleriophila TaxID=389348 RepID=A0A0U5ERY4_9BACT|nr:hypothetical protein [Candidatus Protochlamydia naegleriophila]CUI16944.1 putative secreted protein [Candidatus Protochlamydia naegleriophila]
MKRIFLGLTLLLSTQVVDVFANDNQAAETFEIQQVNELNEARSRRNDDKILPRVGKTIFSTSSAAIFADGTITNTDSTLTVLNKGQGLARISIGSLFGVHEFLIGRVGNEYFGTSVDREGTIVLERVSDKHLEVTLTRIVDATSLPIQVRIRFRL